jgi:capsular polysaccharide biosynthesis protein
VVEDLRDARLNGGAQGFGVEYGARAAGHVEGYGAPRGEGVVSPKEVLRVIWRRLWAVVLVAAVLTGSAVGFSLLQTPTYEASIKILVGQEDTKSTGSNLGSDVQGLENLSATVAKAVNTRPVAEAAAKKLKMPGDQVDQILQDMTVRQIDGTQFVEVYYRDTDPGRAQLVANTIGDVFSRQISAVSPNANAVTATVWERAALPGSPVSPDPLRNGVVALVIGLMMGVGLAFLIEQLDDRWRTPEEVEQASGVPTFGVIPTFRTDPPRGVRVKKVRDEESLYAEKGGR